MVRVIVVSLVLAAAAVATAQPLAKKPTIDNGALTAAEVVSLGHTLADDPSRFDDSGGAVVARTVIVGGPWAALGIREGDTLTAINGVELPTVAELRAALSIASNRRILYVEVVRKKKPVLLRRVVAGVAKTTAGDADTAPALPGDVVELMAVLDASVTQIDATTVEISAAGVDHVLANPMAVAKGARIMPSTKNGQSNGFKLYAVRPTSLYSRLGFSNGDTVHAVNGVKLDTMDRVLDVYATLRNTDRLAIELTRRGKPLTLTILIRR